jgi:hypothetical protein
MMSQAGTSDDPAAAGNAARTSGPFGELCRPHQGARQAHIVATSTIAGNPAATVEVQGRPDGIHRRQEAADEQRTSDVGRDRAARDQTRPSVCPKTSTAACRRRSSINFRPNVR